VVCVAHRRLHLSIEAVDGLDRSRGALAALAARGPPARRPPAARLLLFNGLTPLDANRLQRVSSLAKNYLFYKMLDAAHVFALCAPLLQIETTGFCVCMQNETALVADPIGELHPWLRFQRWSDKAHRHMDIHILHVTEPPTQTRLHTVIPWYEVQNATCVAQKHVHALDCGMHARRRNKIITLNRIEARRCNTYRVDLYE